jgi:hypothetical protein
MNKIQLEEVERLDAAITFIWDAKEAFIAISNMLQPERSENDEQLNLVHRSQAAAIFRFFGNALEEPVRAIGGIKDRLEMIAMKGGAA